MKPSAVVSCLRNERRKGMDEIEWHQQAAILAIDGYVEVEFSECFRKHWYSVAYKGSECNDDFKRFAVGFVDDYLEMLNRLKEMVEALPEGRDRTITASDEEDEVILNAGPV